MAVEIFCDYCGEQIVGYYATVKPHGRHNDSIGTTIRDREFHFHSGEAEDEESCYNLALRPLSNIADWAHRREGSGLVWRLVDSAAGRETDPESGRPGREEFTRRCDAGTPIYGLSLSARAQQSLYSANLVTLEEVAGRTEDQVRSIPGVGDKTAQRLGEALEELGLAFQPGMPREEAI